VIEETRTIRFAEQLAAALNRVVPDDVALAAIRNGCIRIMAGSGTGFAEVPAWWLSEPPSPEEQMAFAEAVLSALQDEVIEGSAMTGWPPADPDHPDAPQRAAELPEPRAELVGEDLLCWYGDRARPALELPPIRIRVVE
jgi:hypothetical protein